MRVDDEDLLNFSKSGWCGRILSAMKVLIPILIGWLVVGCGEQRSITNPSKSDNTPGKPAKKKVEKETPPKELTLRERVVGTYEVKEGGNAYRSVLLEDGMYEQYRNGEKDESEYTWKIVDGEIHVGRSDGMIIISRINNDSSITGIATIGKDGKRTVAPKGRQITLKKIK